MSARGGDRERLLLGAALRAVATGMMGVVLGLYLAQVGLSPGQIGQVVSAGLLGQALATVGVTLGGDRWGRRRSLIVLAALSALGSAWAALGSGFAPMLLASGFGMLNGMGRDRGAAPVLEQAALPSTGTEQDRTRSFALYSLLQDLGGGLGALLAGLPMGLMGLGLGTELAWRAVIALHGLMSLGVLLAAWGLSPQIEAARPRLSLAPESRRVILRISALFAVDAIAGGFLTASLIAWFFFERFGVSVGALGILYAAAKGANALSHLGAAWLARRIGLVNTMVFTHIPSSLLLVTVAFAPSFPVAAALFLLREGLVEMDVPTRSSYVMAMVKPEERTLAAGITGLVRVLGWALAPALAGVLFEQGALALPLVLAAGMKIAYDLALWVSFRALPPPEERTA